MGTLIFLFAAPILILKFLALKRIKDQFGGKWPLMQAMHLKYKQVGKVFK